MDEGLAAVIAANRAVQQEARRLNVRAGENIFPLKSAAELRTWLTERIGGAVSVGTIPDIDALRLPELLTEEVTLVRELNPDTITVLGTEVPVEYREPQYGSPRSPQVTLGEEFVAGNRWLGLPDEGIFLPGGRQVSVVLKSASSYYALAEGADIVLLKQDAKRRLNEGQWTSWSQDLRPAINIPDPADEAAVLPEIATAQYGTCVVTGEPLFAFGTLAVNRSRYYTTDPLFKVEWFLTRAEAESKLSEAQAKLESARVEAREKAERETLKAAAEAAREELKGLSSRKDWNKLDDSLRQEVEGRTGYYARLPETTPELRQWVAEIKALYAKVEAALEAVFKSLEADALRRAGAEPRPQNKELSAPQTMADKLKALQEKYRGPK